MLLDFTVAALCDLARLILLLFRGVEWAMGLVGIYASQFTTPRGAG